MPHLAQLSDWSWALWLAVPVGATVLAALATWVRTLLVRRAARTPSTPEAIRRHDAYLAALVLPARSSARVNPPDQREESVRPGG